MSLLTLFDRKDRPELRKIVETNVPGYKDTVPDHTNHTFQIMAALKTDRINQNPYNTFAEKVELQPKYAIKVLMEKRIEGSEYPTLILEGGLSFNPTDRVLISTAAGELNGEKVEQVQEDTAGALFEYTEKFVNAKHDQEKGLVSEKDSIQTKQSIQEKDSTQESEPKSIF